MYNIIFSRVRVTIVAEKKQQILHILCVCVCVCVCVGSIIYPASKMHGPYHIVICDLSGSITFFHVILKTARFPEKKNLLNVKYLFRSPLQLLSETFLFPRRINRGILFRF
jgi:hypothetical protein